MRSSEAYRVAKLKGFSEDLQTIACREPAWAYRFVKDVPGADVDVCMRSACENTWYAYYFARYVKGADVVYCKAHMGGLLNGYLADEMRMVLR